MEKSKSFLKIEEIDIAYTIQSLIDEGVVLIYPKEKFSCSASIRDVLKETHILIAEEISENGLPSKKLIPLSGIELDTCESNKLSYIDGKNNIQEIFLSSKLQLQDLIMIKLFIDGFGLIKSNL